MNEPVPSVGTQQTVALAFVRALENSFQSFGSLLINNGVGARTILAAIKRALIHSAEATITTHGRPATPARIAALTGFTQAELSQGKGIGPLIGVQKATSPATALLHLWFTSSKYCSQFTGEPLPLRFTSKIGPSFSSLVRDTGGTNPDEFLQELSIAGAISSAVSDEDQQIYYKPKQRAFFYPIQTEDSARYIGESLTNLTASLTHNAATEDHAARLINRRAFSEYPVSEETAREFRARFDKQVSKILEEASDWLSTRSADAAGEVIGLQIFQYAVPRHALNDVQSHTNPSKESPHAIP
jgi:Family of unknown function (DUF6502)